MHRSLRSNRPYWEEHSQGQVDALGPEGAAEAAALAPETEPRTAASTSHPGAQEGATSQDEEGMGYYQPTALKPSDYGDLLSGKVRMMVESLLEKFKINEPITQVTLIKMVGMKYSHHFAKIIKRTSARMQLLFGLKLKKVNRRSHIYALVSKQGLADNASLSGYMGLPTSGLLMSLLGVIFMKGNRATEEEVWEFLNMLGIYDGRSHPIIDDPRRLITEELVQQKYLEYRQVHRSKPPRYELRWGARAHAETSKMRVLKVLAKIHDTVPSSFPKLYKQALRDEKERARVKAASAAKAPEASGATSHSSCNI
ncbi:hypothetical protein MC885_015866 [Smutsia gigantea]|nr:hypothetical protein MC885_015866 [Smutsia gigantea]